MILQAALLVASLACYTVATAVVPLPSTGRAQLSPSKLRHRQTSKMDIVRRASKLRKRQNGPSAVPAP